MNFETLLTTIISSSVIATILSSLISLRLKKLDFKNEYFKIVIKKRLEAYEELEYIIAALKTSALDANDQKAYHVCFFSPDNFNNFSARLALVNAHNLWLNAEANEKLSQLNLIFNQLKFEFNISIESELILSGKKYYSKIAELRTQIENVTRRDILTLYDFKPINKKIVEDGYQIIRLKRKS
jgi:hypothetical protein